MLSVDRLEIARLGKEPIVAGELVRAPQGGEAIPSVVAKIELG